MPFLHIRVAWAYDFLLLLLGAIMNFEYEQVGAGSTQQLSITQVIERVRLVSGVSGTSY